jgi:hypothetical protein
MVFEIKGAFSSYTDEGPPERIMPRILFSFKSGISVLKG